MGFYDGGDRYQNMRENKQMETECWTCGGEEQHNSTNNMTRVHIARSSYFCYASGMLSSTQIEKRFSSSGVDRSRRANQTGENQTGKTPQSQHTVKTKHSLCT